MVARQIEYCQPHYNELLIALSDRQLGSLMSKDSEELRDRLLTNQVDVTLNASAAITSSAIHVFGIDAVVEANGCPVCAFQNVINYVADHQARMYLPKN